MSENTTPFGERMVRAIEDAIIKQVRDGSIIKPDYANSLKIDMALVREAYEQINRDSVRAQITALIENKLADALWNAMATEFATDVKKVLSDNDLRAEIRVYIRNEIRKAGEALATPERAR